MISPERPARRATKLIPESGQDSGATSVPHTGGRAPRSPRETERIPRLRTPSPGRSGGGLLIGLPVLLLLGIVFWTGGCNIIKAVALMTAPHSEKVPAEFARLPSKRVLVHVWVPPEVAWDYPKARLDLAAHLSGYLQQSVRNVSVVDPLQVETYLERSRLPETDPARIGEHFNADMVIHLAVYHFALRDPGMAHFYRGRISASVVVYDLTRPDAPPEQISLGEVAVAVPEEGHIGFTNIRPEQLRQQTYQVFTVEVGKKFHDWERPLD